MIERADRIISLGAGAIPCKTTAVSVELDTLPEVEAWCSKHIRHYNQRVALVVGDDVSEETSRPIIEFLHDWQYRSVISQATVEYKGPIAAINFIKNLKRGIPLPPTDMPLRGYPAFIVGAGPSLDKNIGLLGDCEERGLVVSVNTSRLAAAPYAAMHVCIETKDLSDHGRCNVVDLTANTANWSPLTRWGICSADPNLAPYAPRLGGLPLPYGSSVSTAAASLAHFLGADPIILIGMDNAYTDKMYATGTPFDDMGVSERDDLLHFDGHTKAGKPILPVPVEGWGGGTVISTHNFLGVRDWFSRAANQANLINCTEGGARIPGVPEHKLSDILKHLPTKPPPVFEERPPMNPWMVLNEIHAMADSLIHSVWDQESANEAIRRFPLIHMFLTPAKLKLQREKRLTPRQTQEALKHATLSACREILDA